MTNTYKSKIGTEFILLAYLPLISLFYFVYTDFKFIGIVFIGLLFMFITYLVLTTTYIINTHSKQLVVQVGFIVHKTIPIEKIKTIRKSKSWISSPALSLDRIEINYNKFDSILISPKKREQFIQELKQINPNIELQL